MDRCVSWREWWDDNQLTASDNTLILIQYAQTYGAEEGQIREMLGISKLVVDLDPLSES
jgi:hypothetical protein